MQERYPLKAREALSDEITGCMPGITAIFLLTGGNCWPADERIERIAAVGIQLDADALAVEWGASTLVMACDRSLDIYLAALCQPGIDVRAVARAMQLQLAAGPVLTNGQEVLPIHVVRSSLSRWQWQLSQAFGTGYATRLVARALAGRSPASLSRAQLDEIRRTLIARTGGCLDLAESR